MRTSLSAIIRASLVKLAQQPGTSQTDGGSTPVHVKLDRSRIANPASNMDSYSLNSVENYYNKLLSSPGFSDRVGGSGNAHAIASSISATPIYHEYAGPDSSAGGYYNPVTGNVVVNTGSIDPNVLTHELGHRMYYSSPEYSERIKSIMARHGIKYVPGLYWTKPLTRPMYYNQPTEQAAELQALRMQHGAYPGTGSGAGGKFTDEDVDNMLPIRGGHFGDKPKAYIRDLLNEARNTPMGGKMMPAAAGSRFRA